MCWLCVYQDKLTRSGRESVRGESEEVAVREAITGLEEQGWRQSRDLISRRTVML